MELEENQTVALLQYSNISVMPVEYRVVFGIVALICGICGSVGNFLVPVVVWRNKTFRGSAYFLITNLALSDLLICGVCLPITFVSVTMSVDWQLGRPGCAIFEYVIHMSFAASSLTLLAISWDRYFGFVYLWHQSLKLTRKKAKMVIVLIWVFSSIFMTPIALFHTVVTKFSDNKPFLVCTDVWSSAAFEKCFWSLVAFVYISSVVQMSLLYFFIGRTLWLGEIPRQDAPSLATSCRINQEVQALKEKRKIIKLLFTLVFIYITCWSPYVFTKLINVFRGLENAFITLLTTSILGISQSVINPVAYAVVSKRFRQAFKDLLCRNSRRVNIQNHGAI